MEPIVDPMADLLSAVSTVISNFTSWFTSMTTALIANPVIQLIFGLGIALLLFRITVGLIKGKKSRKKR